MSASTSAPDATPHLKSRPLYAIFLRLVAMAVMTATFAMVKLLNQRGVNIVELVFYRQTLAIPIIYAWIMATTGRHGIATKRLDLHLTRTGVGLLAMLLNFGSVALLPLAEATTIGFTSPIFATILAAVFLHEKTGIHRWSAVLIGFIGVVVIARPDTGHLPLIGVSVSIAAAVGVAVISMLLRQLSRTETAPATVFWFSVMSVPPVGILLFWFGQGHDLQTWLMLGLLGIIGGISQLLVTSSLSWGPVSIVLAMDYTAILWSALAGWLLWDTLPGKSTWAGAVLIIGSGLYIAWREHRRGQDAKLKAQAEADMRA